jgi:cell division protein FtsZ
LNAEKTVSDSEARVVFDLMEDSTAPEAVVPVAGNEELMAMSEFIRNLDVSLKLFLLLRD